MLHFDIADKDRAKKDRRLIFRPSSSKRDQGFSEICMVVRRLHLILSPSSSLEDNRGFPEICIVFRRFSTFLLLWIGTSCGERPANVSFACMEHKIIIPVERFVFCLMDERERDTWHCTAEAYLLWKQERSRGQKYYFFKQWYTNISFKRAAETNARGRYMA